MIRLHLGGHYYKQKMLLSYVLSPAGDIICTFMGGIFSFFFFATTGLTMKVLPFRYFCILSHRDILCLVHQQDNTFIADRAAAFTRLIPVVKTSRAFAWLGDKSFFWHNSNQLLITFTYVARRQMEHI